MAKRRLRIVLVVLLIPVVAIALLGIFFRSIVSSMMKPHGPFDARRVPAAPDYAQPAAWSALPDQQDAADVALPELPAIDQRAAAVDVFYVHPTTYVGNDWNGRIDDARLNADTDRVATRIQASAWNNCCAIYAPRYRQANGTEFYRPSADGDRALEVAYGDVATAFRFYVEHHNHDRPFLIAGHSQGSVLATRLVREQIVGTPLQKRLIAAYLIGAPVHLSELTRDASTLPVCANPTQTGCVVVWNARGARYQRGEFEIYSGHAPGDRSDPALCVNPISFRADEEAVPERESAGALFFDSAQPKILPAFASARCQRGTLIVKLFGKPPRDFMSRLLDRALGEENYHPIEYQLFFVDLRNNAAARVAAFTAR